MPGKSNWVPKDFRKWRKGKIHHRKGHGRGRWMYPNGKKKGRRWMRVSKFRGF